MSEFSGIVKEHRGAKLRKRTNGTWMADLHRDGKRQRKVFNKLAEAKSWVEGRRSLRLKEASALTDRQILDACDALTILKAYDKSATLTEAADLFVAQKSANDVAWTVQELFDAHFEDLEAGERRATTIAGKRTRLNLFCQLFGETPITEISTKDIEDWGKAIGAKGRNKQNYESALQSLFNFAEKHAPGEFVNKVAKFTHRKKMETEPATIVSPEAAKDVLHALEEAGHGGAAVALAISLFAGVRTSEVVGKPKDERHEAGLHWKHIDLEERTIHIPAHLSKTRDLRDVPICDNLLAWLSKYQKPKGRIGPGYNAFIKQHKEARKATGHDWPNNGARHSAGTYKAKLDGERDAAEMLGHTGTVRIFRAHYSAVTTKAAARKYFHIVPLKKAVK